MDDLKAQQLINEVQQLREEVKTLTEKLLSSRVRIENLEGTFKTFDSAPVAANFKDGSLVFFDDGITRTLYALMNGTFRSVNLT